MGNWPIIPCWLSIVKGKAEREAEINSDGVFLYDTLRGFIADASSYKEISNPLSIFQVVDDSLEFEGEDAGIVQRDEITDEYILNNILMRRKKRIIRIDPGPLFPNLPCCEKFRECKGKELCFNIDGRIAILFHPQLPAIADDSYMARLEEVCTEYNRHHGLQDFYAIKVGKAVVETKGKKLERFYLWYTCPYSKLDKYFFPVTHNNKIIAVIMQGQRPNPKLKDCMFKDYLEDSSALRESVKNLPDRFLAEESLGKARMNTIFSRIMRLEEMLSDAVASKAQKYASDIIRGVEDAYKAKLREIKDPSKGAAFEDVKSGIGEALASICEKFGDCKFIRIFSQKTDIEVIDSSVVEFELIGSSDPAYKPVQLQFRKEHPNKNMENGELRGYMVNPSIVEEGDVFRMEVQLGNGIRYIIWKRYGSWKKEYSDQYEIYKNRVTAMYSNLLEPYYILKSTMLEKQLENSMRFTSHESAQIIPLVIDALKDEHAKDVVENKVERNIQYTMQIPSYAVVDSIYRLMLLGKLLKTPSLIFRDSLTLRKTMNREWIDVHRMVYSTKSLFEKKATVDKFQEIYIDFEKGLRSKSLLIDYNYMSHILFNLVDNAIKYGLKGSRIIISVKEVKENYSPKIKISIVNYCSSPIDNKDVIFDLYYRGNQSHAVEGTGMGLFVVKKLSSLLGLEVECAESSLVVKGLNVPYIYHYKKRPGNILALSQITQDKLNNAIDDGIVDDVVNKRVYNWEIGLREIQNNIDIDIYRNEFTVTIPLDEDNIKDI